MSELNVEAHARICAEARDLAIKKCSDYGLLNIQITGEYGCMVRGLDKLMRTKVLLEKEMRGLSPEVQDEKLEDTALDLINYACYILMLRRGLWDARSDPKMRTLPAIENVP
jgi:hypothetical protein